MLQYLQEAPLQFELLCTKANSTTHLMYMGFFILLLQYDVGFALLVFNIVIDIYSTQDHKKQQPLGMLE